MSSPAILVVSTVHRADDTRIREKLIRSLEPIASVTYASRPPAPSDPGGIDQWIELRGGRARRNVAAARLLFSRDHDLAVVHDPELLPAAILASLAGRRPVIVDVHENVPAQLRTKEWVPRMLRGPLAWIAAVLLRLAERTCSITLAEPGYRRLFSRDHPVFANYPDALPEPAPSDGSIVYVGDVTRARGVTDLARAVEQLPGSPVLRVIGPCPDELRLELERLSIKVEMLGPRPHTEAMDTVARAAVGVAPLRDVPNYRYSLPTKVIEYLGSGVPVVASDLPGTREAIEDLPGVKLVPPGDIVALAEALGETLADPAHRAAAQAGAGAVRSRFRWPADDVRAYYRNQLQA
ncbi:MAG: glycosyltransferase [Acidimicrobiia bacterium]|nr:glycosyltransferase [Acidimicrobiia bacterium]